MTWSRELGAFTLFATHYFELTSLADELAGCANVHLDATEHGEELVFLHAVREGPANRSYGLQVARLAGVPREVIADARRYLAGLERRDHATRRRRTASSALPLDPRARPVERTVHRRVAASGSGRPIAARRARGTLPPAAVVETALDWRRAAGRPQLRLTANKTPRASRIRIDS